MIVGAPLRNDTSPGNKPNSGGVYRCDLNTNNRACDILTNFDSISPGKGLKSIWVFEISYLTQ